MKSLYYAFGVVVAALVVGCGGTSTSSTTTSTTSSTTSTTASTTGATTGGTVGGSVSTGSYSGSFTGSYVENGLKVSYSGTGTGTISTNGSATFNYTAVTSGTLLQTLNRSFVGTVGSNGSFVGYISIAPYGGGAVQNLAATGTVTAVSSTQITVAITWSYPYANGGTFYTSTENWTMTLQ